MKRSLEDAYLRTSYVVQAPRGHIVLRVREPNPALDALSAEYGAGEWAFVTACNPHSVTLPEGENEERQKRLRTWIGEHRLAALPGVGVGEGGGWPPEPSFLVFGISKAWALDLGRAFGQNAVVIGRAGGAPELLWCFDESETDGREE